MTSSTDALIEILKKDYMSVTGKFKLRKMPETLIQNIINHTLFYNYYEDQHLSVRCHFIINEITELNVCKECGAHIHPINLQKYKTQNYCSVACSVKNQDVQEKSKKSNLEKYGSEYATQNKNTIEKQKKTNLQKYGVESVLQNKEIFEKKTKTTISRHGIVSCFEKNEIQTKIKKYNLEKYGVEYPLSNSDILNKTKDTMIEKYGTKHAGLCHIGKENLEIINNKQLFTELITGKTLTEISSEINIKKISSIKNLLYQYNIEDLYKKRGPSYLESDMMLFLDSIGIPYEINNRTILNGKELDFYIPTHNIAIEMNGLYYHNENTKPNSDYHYNKWKICSDNNIHLISIFEDDWNFQQDKIKNMLLSHFNMKPSGIAARKTTIKEIGANIAKPFLEKYHLQGFVGGTHFGAFDFNNNLVAVMAFGYTRNHRFELKRFVMDNHNHPGMFSKIFKYAQRELQFQEVVSFSDNTCFTGNVYMINNFQYVQTIPQDYKYFFNGKRVHKSNFTKDNIKKKFPHIAEFIENGMTENEAMKHLGIPKIYDCGKKEWVYNK